MSERVGVAAPVRDRGRLQAIAPMVIFDIAGPLVVYYTLSANGFSTVDALILSGILPAFGTGLTVLRHRRLDASDTAKTTSNLLPLVFAAGLIVWNVWYAKRGARRGAVLEAAARARGDTLPAMPI